MPGAQRSAAALARVGPKFYEKLARLFCTAPIVAARTALLFVVAACLMGPITSDTVSPASPDHPNHAAAIVQARQAIDEGQLPLRTAPWQHGGMRYPHTSSSIHGLHTGLVVWCTSLFVFPENGLGCRYAPSGRRVQEL